MKTCNLDKIEKYMLANMPSSDPVHGPEHIYRVLTNAWDIAAHCEQAFDQNILVAACLLHDIGRIEHERRPQFSHAQLGSWKVFSFLGSIGWEEKDAQAVADAILTHSQHEEHQAVSIEAQLLFDADKLDTMGFIGIARLLMHTGEQGTPLYQFDDNGQLFLNKNQEASSFLQDYQSAEETAKNLYTAYARRLASEKFSNTRRIYEGLVRDITCYHEHLQTIRTSLFN